MFSLIILLAAGSATGCNPSSDKTEITQQETCTEDHLRMTDIVMVGTHNSYKLAIPPAELEAMVAINPEAIGLDYAHRSLTEQLNAGARQLEIDILNDPEGGRYARPLSALGSPDNPVHIDDEFKQVMSQPGFKTLHIPDIDFRSSCLTFIACLEEIRAWSDAHPDHAPILIMLNAKTGEASMPGGTQLLDFDSSAWNALDAEIRSVFADGRLITPDQVRGGHTNLRESVLAGGWPSLKNARGKVFFALDEGPEKVASYAHERPSLEGRAMFVNTDETSPAAAYLTLNDPIRQQEHIKAVIRQGFIVRTRADANTVEARAEDLTRYEAAISSGAQYISTDYLWADPRFPAYQVRLSEGLAAACNHVRLGDGCDGITIEALAGPDTP